MDDYNLYLSLDVLDLIKGIKGKRKSEVIQFLHQVRVGPFLKGEFQKLKDGRTLEIKVLGKYSIYYWADHPVKEIKIVEIVKSDE